MPEGVIDLDAYRPHTTGIIGCRSCGYEWVSVWPTEYADPTRLECPRCEDQDSVPPPDLEEPLMPRIYLPLEQAIAQYERANDVKLVCKRDDALMRRIGLVWGSWLTRWWTTYKLPWPWRDRRPRITYPVTVDNPFRHPVTLQHEMVHVGQMRGRGFLGMLWMLMLALLLPLPVLFSGRWLIEREAYLVELREGRLTVQEVVRRLWRGYAMAWPPFLMRRWFKRRLAAERAKGPW